MGIISQLRQVPGQRRQRLRASQLNRIALSEMLLESKVARPT